MPISRGQFLVSSVVARVAIGQLCVFWQAHSVEVRCGTRGLAQHDDAEEFVIYDLQSETRVLRLRHPALRDGFAQDEAGELLFPQQARGET
jgi:hypothetical protein